MTMKLPPDGLSAPHFQAGKREAGIMSALRLPALLLALLAIVGAAALLLPSAPGRGAGTGHHHIDGKQPGPDPEYGHYPFGRLL